MKYLFIDANIWLSLYHFSNDDLDQFSKLKALKKTDIKIIIPRQTRYEVQRNRDAKIKDSLSRFEKFDFSFPAFSKSYAEYEEFYKDYSSLRQRHKVWCEKIHRDIDNQDLPADKVIKDYFDSCPVVECTETIIHDAELRFRIGNPPGKDNKLGDAINWECLLSCIPNGEDLFFVSADKDYRSVIDDREFNLFLKEEWQKKKKSNIHYYVNLSSFIKAHAEEIKLQTEQKKDELINGLKESRNFQTTHAVIRSLNEFNDWSEQQIDDLCTIAIDNSQVMWILGDDDVLSFYEGLLSSTRSTSESIVKIKNYITEIIQSELEDKDDLPF